MAARLSNECLHPKTKQQKWVTWSENILCAYMIEYLTARCFGVPNPDLLLLLKVAAVA